MKMIFSIKNLLLLLIFLTANLEYLQSYTLQRRKEVSKLFSSSSFKIPESPRDETKAKAVNAFLLALTTSTTLLLNYNSISNVARADDFDENSAPFVDSYHKFKLIIPTPGWNILKKASAGSTSLGRFAQEESLITATCFAEGSSLSVTKTMAGRLLKDMDIEWWFAPLEKMSDVGGAALVAQLLILQRQGEFEKKQTSSEILSAVIDDKGVLTFDFLTPIVEEVKRRSKAKAYFRDGYLYTCWISALSSVFENDDDGTDTSSNSNSNSNSSGGYGSVLTKIVNSFTLI